MTMKSICPRAALALLAADDPAPVEGAPSEAASIRMASGSNRSGEGGVRENCCALGLRCTGGYANRASMGKSNAHGCRRLNACSERGERAMAGAEVWLCRNSQDNVKPNEIG